MRALLLAPVATLWALPLPAAAQDWSPSVNQRMNSPTSQSDSYMGVSLGQLIMALGLTLQGVPPQGLDDIRLLHPRQTAAAPAPALAPTGTAVVPAAKTP
jgi:hypothetical protein